MRFLLLTSIAALTSLPSFAQNAGLPPEWEVRKQLDELVQQTRRFEPLLNQIQPADWVANGAPEAYIAQHKSALDEVKYIAQQAASLSQKTDRMSLALDTYFRLQALESRLSSISEGIRRYQNPAAADLLNSLITDTSGSREKLRQYVLDLVAMREQEHDSLEAEAQRCRAGVTRTATPPAPKTPAISGRK